LKRLLSSYTFNSREGEDKVNVNMDGVLKETKAVVNEQYLGQSIHLHM
jgi:hypothetical protein